jgi:HEAT repeat protein
MRYTAKLDHTVRRGLSVALVVLGLLGTWAWGEVARTAAAPEPAAAGRPAVEYAAWQPDGADHPVLFRTAEDGSWQPVSLPEDAAPAVWAGDGGDRVAVVTAGGRLLLSESQGQDWMPAGAGLRPLSLVWESGPRAETSGTLLAGTDGQGVYRIAAGHEPVALAAAGSELAGARVTRLAVAGGRLFAATPTALFYSDDGGEQWSKSLPPQGGGVTALAAADMQTVYIGTGMLGVFKTTDAGQTWQPAIEGLGLAAGENVAITALRVDPSEPGVLYAAVEYGVGSTHVVYSAQGTFVSVDGGASWQPMAGPLFPEAKKASNLVLVAGRPLAVEAVTAAGLQTYEPDVAAAMVQLEDPQPQRRAAAARLLGLARAKEASHALLAALADPDPAVSMAAAGALGRINEPANASALLVALDNPSEPVRLGAARALGQMKNEAAVAPLRAMLLTGQGAEVGVAAEALGRIGSPAAVDALLVALADPALTPRRHAAMGALEIVGAPAVDPLARMLDGNPEPAARRNAAEALGWISSTRATPALAGALKDRDAAVRERAAWALGEIADPSARAALERAAARDQSPVVQAAAQAALRQIQAQPRTAASGPVSLAAALNRLQPARWVLLIGSWAAAAWLAVTSTRLRPVAAVSKR